MRLGSAGLTQGRGRLKVLHMSLTSLLGVSGLCASLATAAVSRGQSRRLPWHLSSGTQPLCHSGLALPTATWSWLPCEDSGRGFGCELQFPRACEHWSGEHSQCLTWQVILGQVGGAGDPSRSHRPPHCHDFAASACAESHCQCWSGCGSSSPCVEHLCISEGHLCRDLAGG